MQWSLVPLFFHCHNENPHVAEVRIPGLLVSPWEGAQLPPALVPGRLQPPPGRGTGMWVLCPGLWGHLRISAAFQASRETLHCAAKFLKMKDLKKLLKEEQLWKFAECLVRIAWKDLPQFGEAPCPQCSLCALGSCGPAQCCRQGPHGLFSRLLWPRTQFPWSPGPAGQWGMAAPWLPGHSRPSAPAERGASGCWPRLRAERAREAGAGCGQRLAKGQSPARPFPAAALCSWPRTGAQRPSTCARPCHTCRVHRSPCERRPSGSWVSPGSLPAPPQLGPSRACCPGSAIRARRRGALAALRAAAALWQPCPWASACGRARAEPCQARRASGHRAGSAAARELCRWGRDRLCVCRACWAQLEGAAGRAAADLQR